MIRPVTPRDIKPLVALLNENISYGLATESYYGEALDKNIHLVHEENATICGYISSKPFSQEDIDIPLTSIPNYD